jgi:hypothetical protein
MELHEYFEDVMKKQEATAGITDVLSKEIDRIQPVLEIWSADSQERQNIVDRCRCLNKATKNLGPLNHCNLVIPPDLIPLSVQVEGFFPGQFFPDEIMGIDNWGREGKIRLDPYLVIGTSANFHKTPKWYNLHRQQFDEQTLNLAEALAWLPKQDTYTLSHTRDYLVKADDRLIRIRRSAEQIMIFPPQRKQPSNSYPQFLLTCSQRKFH